MIRKYKENKLSIEGAALIGRHTRIGDHSKISDSNIDNLTSRAVLRTLW